MTGVFQRALEQLPVVEIDFSSCPYRYGKKLKSIN
jgi:hypothetical protein